MKQTTLINMNIIESILKPTHREAAIKEKKDRVWASWAFSNFFTKNWVELLARMVATPLNDSLSIAKIGDLERLSKRFNSREVVTKTRRTDVK